MTTNVATTRAAGVNRGRFYRTLWRWHFYAGLCCVPIILTLSVSGGIYLFKPQIDAWIDAPYRQLEPGPVRATPTVQIKTALASLPGARFLSYRLPVSDREAVVVSMMHGGARKLVYVDPYKLDVLKTVGFDTQFLRQVRGFHGELLAGNFGSILVELAGCWAIVLLLTGLYLWWPRSAAGLAGVLYPRLRRCGRIFWRDLHAVTGMWISLLLLFLLISGLPWTLVWGTAFSELRQIGGQFAKPSWSQGRAAETQMWRKTSLASVELPMALYQQAQSLRFAPPAELSSKDSDGHRWSLNSEHQNRTLRASATLNGSDGHVLSVRSFSKRPLLDRVIGIGIAAHEGALFGRLNQALGVVIIVGAITLSISGTVMWYRRKPDGVLGAPPAFADARAGKAVTAIMLGLACVLPLLAASLITLWLLEWLLKHIPPAARWLGLPT